MHGSGSRSLYPQTLPADAVMQPCSSPQPCNCAGADVPVIPLDNDAATAHLSCP
jgi:hypothetical protein